MGDPDTGLVPPARRPPNWKAVLYAAAALALLSVGSVIGSAHARSSAHAAATAAASSAPTVTAMVTASVNAPTSTAGAVDALALLAHGIGAGHTSAFVTTNVTFQVAWTYDCAPTRSLPRFVATLHRNGDKVAPVADLTGPSAQGDHYLPNGRGTFTVVIAVPDECRWTIAVIDSPAPYYP